MMNQKEMFNYFQERLHSHDVTLEGNKIKGKRLINSRSFSSFTIRFLKNSNEVSINTGHGVTLRYSDQDELFCIMGAFSRLLTDEEYNHIRIKEKEDEERKKNLDKFYWLKNDHGVKEFVEAYGKKINVDGLQAFIKDNEDNTYSVVEARTGLNLSTNFKTHKEVIKAASKAIKDSRDKLEYSIDKSIERYGISPLYQKSRTV